MKKISKIDTLKAYIFTLLMPLLGVLTGWVFGTIFGVMKPPFNLNLIALPFILILYGYNFIKYIKNKDIPEKSLVYILCSIFNIIFYVVLILLMLNYFSPEITTRLFRTAFAPLILMLPLFYIILWIMLLIKTIIMAIKK